MSDAPSRSLESAAALVVGGAGFVGSNLARALCEGGAVRVTVIDNLLSADRDNVPDLPQVEFVEGSICDDDVLAGVADEYDFVFHLATFHGNQNSIARPLEDHENNTLPTLRLLEHIRAFERLQMLVYASAGCTVAEKTFDCASATSEDAPVSLYLDSPYQISKIVGEFYSNYYTRQHGVPVAKARFQNVYGPGEVLGAGRWRGTPSTVWRNVVPTFVYRAIKGLPLKLDRGGVATRDFIYVDDVCQGLIACALRGEPAGVYNIASGEETSIAKLAELIVEIVGDGGSSLEAAEARWWDRSGKRFGSTDKARDELGFEARVHLRSGLERTVEWTRRHLDAIDANMARHAPDVERCSTQRSRTGS